MRRVPGTASERFWDERARESALFYVDNRLDYRAPDEAAFWAGGEEALDRLLELTGVALRPEDVVLDIGCGVGRLTRVAAARAGQVIGVDVSSEMLERARALNAALANARWVHGDGRGLPGVGEGEVDAVISLVVFQHVPDPAVTLGYVREMGRVLRPGGWAAFQVSTDPSIHRPRSAAARLRWRLAALAGRGPQGQEHPAWLGSAVTVEGLREAAEAGGMELERVLGAPSQFTTVLARRR